MMSRDKLFALRAQTKEGNLPDRDQILALIDNLVQARVELAGGGTVEQQRAALKERERQVGLALKDLRETIGDNPVEVGPHKAQFILDMIDQMLKAKGPAWHREWAFYQPRIAEEFEDA